MNKQQRFLKLRNKSYFICEIGRLKSDISEEWVSISTCVFDNGYSVLKKSKFEGSFKATLRKPEFCVINTTKRNYFLVNKRTRQGDPVTAFFEFSNKFRLRKRSNQGISEINIFFRFSFLFVLVWYCWYRKFERKQQLIVWKYWIN